MLAAADDWKRLMTLDTPSGGPASDSKAPHSADDDDAERDGGSGDDDDYDRKGAGNDADGTGEEDEEDDGADGGGGNDGEDGDGGDGDKENRRLRGLQSARAEYQLKVAQVCRYVCNIIGGVCA